MCIDQIVCARYHFADGRNANDVDTLVLAAEEAGLDGKKAREGLEDRDIRSKVDTMLMAARTVRGQFHQTLNVRVVLKFL